MTNKKEIGSIIYANVLEKHPDWSRARVYAVTRSILAAKEKKTAKNPAKAEA